MPYIIYDITRRCNLAVAAIWAGVVLLLLCCSSCNVHEFPDEASEVNLTINLQFDPDMPIYREITYVQGKPASEAPRRSADTANDIDIEPTNEYDIRYILAFYRKLPNGQFETNPEKHIVVTRTPDELLNHSISATIAQGTYRIIAWADYVDVNSIQDKFYDTSALHQEVSLFGNQTHYGNNDMRDAFRSIHIANVSGSTKSISIKMERPMGMYIFIADNLEEMIARSNALKAPNESKATDNASSSPKLVEGMFRVQFKYTGFMPSAYNIVHDFNADSSTGKSFDSIVSAFITRSNEVVLGYDYVFINPTGGAVELAVTIFDHTGAEVAKNSNIIVPLKQGHITILRGDFTTSSTSDGLGISPDFTGPDYNIRI